MLITKIILRDFGKFGDFTADFSPGLNLIKGPNEAGKSTLAGAVATALFADPVSGTGQVAEAVRWGENRAPFLEAVLDVDGTKYKLTKDFQQRTAKIEPKDIDFPGGSKTDIGTWLNDKLGITSGEVFRSTACINQGEIDRIDDSIEAIKDKLESLATRGKEEQAASSTLKKIEKRKNELSGEIGETSGLSSLEKELSYNIEKLGRDIGSLKGKRADLVQMETTYINVRDDLKERKRRLALSEEARETARKSAELSSETDHLREQIEEARELQKKSEEIKSQRSELKRISRGELDEIDQMEASLNYLKPKCSALEEETKEAAGDLQSYEVGRFSVGMAVLGFLGAVLIVACYYYQFIPAILPYIWYSLGGSVSLFLLGTSIAVSRKQHKSYLSKKYEKLAAKLETFRADVDERQINLRARLEIFRVPSVDELKRNHWRYDELEKQIETLISRYNQIMAGNTLSDLEKRLELLDAESKKIDGMNTELSQYLVEPAELERQRLAVNEIDERIKDLERERNSLTQYIEMAEGGFELLASYMERADRLKSRIDNIKHEVKTLDLTAQFIEEARQNVLISKLEILNTRTSEILDNLTAGRYSKVRFDKSNLKFEVWSGEKNGWVEPEKWLSAGTIDQIYLAARLALADLISGEKNSILILDDPFANYDEKRLGNAMKVLKDLSEDHQIFLLSSQDHYDRWADSTINLQ